MSEVKKFEELLQRCMEQSARDPTGVTENPHLYKMLHDIYLRLCHGDIAQAEKDMGFTPGEIEAAE